ncbi:hypothetical protein ABZ725_52445 [Streptomyces sp. NPDC006872]|uniref:effector-associated constant component EACC1 n=1 Tax=Streptomyces sp. NPDC006872 TaxID=3155720 RepID=UPI00340A3920
MQAKIIVGGVDDDRSVTSLYRWLIHDQEVVNHAQISLIPAREKIGEMGVAFEVINAVFNSGIALGNLALACAAWRGSRPSAPVVRIERGGMTITVEDDSDAMRRIIDVLGQPEPETARGGEEQP